MSVSASDLLGYDTPLSPDEEANFQQWKNQYAPNDSGDDYDLRGAFKAGLTPDSDGHWPDTYKKPNHPTFSDESIYASEKPDLAGHWDNGKYIAPSVAITELLDAPQSSATEDFLSRAGQSAVRSTGEAVSGTWRMADEVSGAVQKLAFRTASALGMISSQQADAGVRLTDLGLRVAPEQRTLQEAARDAEQSGDAIKSLADEYHPDPARAGTFASRAAGLLGGLAPALASPGTAAPIIAGQMGESTRDESLAAGDTPELANAKFDLGTSAGAVMGLVRVPVRGAAGILERLAVRTATGAAINAGTDAALQEGTEGKVDWGRVKASGAVGAGLGLALGVPEAIALRRLFAPDTTAALQKTLQGMTADEVLDGNAPEPLAGLEGKTMGDAVTQIAQETGQEPTAVQARINAAVGVSTPVEAATTDIQSQIEQGTGVLVPAGAEDTLFADRLKREERAGQLSEAFGALTDSDEPAPPPPPAPLPIDSATNNAPADAAGAADLQAAMQGGQLAGGESITLGDDPLRNQLTMLETRPGAAAAERARLMQKMSAPPPVDDGSVPPAMRLTGQAQRMVDQHGGIDPRLLFAVGRAALAGAYGYGTGNTPEDKIKRALLFAGAGALASPELVRMLANKIINAPVPAPLMKTWSDTMQGLKLRLSPQSVLPEAIREQTRWGEQATAGITRQGQMLTADLDRGIRTIGNKPAQQVAAQGVQAYLTGRITAAQLPPPLAGHAVRVRDFIDGLTDRAIAQGVVTGDLAQTFLSNRGSYLRRSYQIFADPNFQPAPATIDAAINYVQGQGNTRADAEATIAGMIDKHQRANVGDFMVGRGKIAGKDVSSLMKRGNLAPEIRALLGEITDPVANVSQTIPRLARLIEMDGTQKNIRDLGLKLGIFSQQQDLKYRTPLVSDANGPHDNFQGLFVEPVVAAAFQKAAGGGKLSFVPDAIWKTLSTANYVAKAGKTVGNPAGYLPPIIHNLWAMVANDNFRLDALGRGLKLGAEEAGAMRQFFPNNPTRPQLQEQVARLTKLGIFGQSLHGTDLAATLDQSFWSKLGGTATKPLRIAGQIFGFADPVTKYAALVSEMAKYGKAFPNLPTEQLERRAAETVMNTMPTYSRVPQFLRDFSKVGIVQPFINWHYELYRNIYNTFRIAQQDLREGASTGNTALAKIGARRLATATLTLGASSGAIGYGLYSRRQHGVTDEQDRAVRFFGPPWLQNAALNYSGPVDQGTAHYNNMVYLAPYGAAMQAADAAMRGKTGVDAAKGFFSSLSEQVLGATPGFIPNMLGAAAGVDITKRKEIPKTAVEPTFADKLNFAWEKDFKPLVVPYLQQFGKALSGEEDNYGRTFSVDEQLWRLGAVRGVTTDNAKNLDFKARDLTHQFDDASSLYRTRTNQKLPADKLNSIYQSSETARRGVFDELTKMRDYGRALNLSDDQLVTSMRGAKLPAETILGVLDGKYTPAARDGKPTVGEIWADMQAKPDNERRAKLAEISLQDPALARSVLERWRESARTGPLSPWDQTVKALGVEDGSRADYLRDRIQQIQDPQARRSFLLDLQRKGILTPRVMQQMGTTGR